MVQEDWAYTMRRTMQVKTVLHLQSRLRQASSWLKINNDSVIPLFYVLCVRQEIVPGVYLGPYASAGKKMAASLKASGITHIVCVRS